MKNDATQAGSEPMTIKSGDDIRSKAWDDQLCLRTEPGDLVYSETRGIVGVVKSVNAWAGCMEIHIGNSCERYFENSGKLIRPLWDENSLTYTWERVSVLRDEG